MARGCKTPQEAIHMCTMDGRIDAELTTNICQVEFLATMGWAGQTDPSTA